MIKVVMYTMKNGDQKSVTAVESGETFTNYYTNPRRGEANDVFNEVRNLLKQTKTGGGNPYPGAPHWASDFTADYAGEIPEDLMRRVREVGERA